MAKVEFRHKNIRLNPREYLGQRTYFITLCCENRYPVFADGQNAEWMVDCVDRYTAAFRFSVYAYCVMPDHVHVLATGMHPACNLLAFVKHFKEKTTEIFQAQTRPALWQKKFYDRILRPRDRIEGVAGYIWMNPVRAGLCATPQEYPYSGSRVVDWKKGFWPAELWEPEWRKNKSVRLHGQNQGQRQRQERPPTCAKPTTEARAPAYTIRRPLHNPSRQKRASR